MGKHDTFHRASVLFFEDSIGGQYWYCSACGKEVAQDTAGISYRHKGNVSTFKNGLQITDKAGNLVATVAGNSHSHSGW